MLFRSIKRKIEEKKEKRKKSKQVIGGIDPENWRLVDLKSETFDVPDATPSITHILFKPRSITLLEAFLHYCTIPLLEKVWLERANGDWHYGSERRTINRGDFSASLLYKFLAIKIFIQCTKEESRPALSSRRPLRDNITDASIYFCNLFGDEHAAPGISILERLFASFLFSKEYFEMISNEFRSWVRYLGEFVCGDEKLAHYTGASPNNRFCPNKPAKYGLWFYQLSALMDESNIYLLDLLMYESELDNAVSRITSHWLAIVEELTDGRLETCSIIFDSYYFDNSGRENFIGDCVYYCAGVNKKRFGSLVRMVEDRVKSPGDQAGAYNDETNELFVYSWDTNVDIGKIFVMGNVLERRTVNSRDDGELNLPDYYKETFYCCDRRNKEMFAKGWPHKHGGYNRFGEAAEQSDYAFLSILLNCFNLYRHLSKIQATKTDFRNFGVRLSEQLFLYAIELEGK